ncbi:MAG TPA: DMT family transporter [Sphingomicrobium sp.]|nr:DMT family transporter [Sphingomicrobium sp.]
MNRATARPLNPFAVALAAVGALSIMDAVMKHLVLAIGIFAVSVWRSAANLILSAALYLPRKRSRPDRRTLAVHVSRGVVVTLMAFLFFWGIGRVPLAQAIALTFIAPLIALLLAAFFLGERIGRSSVGGSLTAFAGVIVIVFGQARAQLGPQLLLGSAAIIGSALCYAANIVLMRRQALAARPLEINFFQALTVMALWLAAVAAIGVPDFPGAQWGWIAVASILSTSGTLLFAWAYARGEASYLSVTEYSAFIWASACGWIAFHEKVSLYTFAGALLIIGGCLLAAGRKLPAPPEIDFAA